MTNAQQHAASVVADYAHDATMGDTRFAALCTGGEHAQNCERFLENGAARSTDQPGNLSCQSATSQTTQVWLEHELHRAHLPAS